MSSSKNTLIHVMKQVTIIRIAHLVMIVPTMKIAHPT